MDVVKGTLVKPKDAYPRNEKGVGFFDDLLIKGLIGAKRVWVSSDADPKEKEMRVMLAGLAATHRIRVPKLLVYESDKPNAVSLATGSIAVSTRLMEILTPPQMETVIGHEMSHHRHRLRDLGLTLGALFALNFSYRRLARPHVDAWAKSAEMPHTAGLLQDIALFVADLEVVKAYTRGMEYEADWEGGKFTGRPLDMAGALAALRDEYDKIGEKEKIKRQKAFDRLPEWEKPILRMLDELEPSWVKRVRRNPAVLIDGHPPIESRIKRLERQEKMMHPSGEQVLPTETISR